MYFEASEIRERYHIIDSHGHLGRYRQLNIPYCDAEGIIGSMDASGIEQICVSAFIGLERDYHKLGNDMVADAVKRFGDRILGYACISPFAKEDIIPELERCFDRLGLTAIKLHPGMNGYPAAGSNYIPVYEFAEERGLAILNHSWEEPDHLVRLAEKYTNVRFIAAHDGGAWDGNNEPETFKVVREHDNVYVDNAGSGCYMDVFEKTVECLGDHKIIFGTDSPLIDPRHQLGNVLYARISEESKKRIFRTNFLNVIGKNRLAG